MILGISFDTPEENKEFQVKENFPYRLLADHDRSLGEVFDVAKGADEQYPEFARRKTFLIDPQGVVRKIYSVSDVAAHPDEVLADIKQLSGAA